MAPIRLRRPHLPKPKALNPGRRNLLKTTAAAIAGAIAAEVIEDAPPLPTDAAAQVARAKAEAAKAKADGAEAEAEAAELRYKISNARKALKKEDS